MAHCRPAHRHLFPFFAATHVGRQEHQLDSNHRAAPQALVHLHQPPSRVCIRAGAEGHISGFKRMLWVQGRVGGV